MAFDLARAAESGDRIATLEALRDRLALAVDLEFDPDAECRRPHAQMAPLAKQLADVMRELEALRPQEKASAADEIAAKRTARRAQAALSDRAANAE